MILRILLSVCVFAVVVLCHRPGVKHKYEADKPEHRIRHRHEYDRHIREFLRRRRERRRQLEQKAYDYNDVGDVEPTPSTKSIQKLKHYFYPKDSIDRKIDEIRRKEKEREPNPDIVLRSLGKSEKEIKQFHLSKNSDFLHHLNNSGKVRDREIRIPLEPIEKLEEEFRYDGRSSLPILDRPLYEVPPVDTSDFKPIQLPSGFRHYDIDNDGYVSKDELILVTGAEENANDVFKMADRDEDGLLSREEFRRAPWRLQGDPRRNAHLDRLRAEVENEQKQTARRLHLDYIPRVTVGEEKEVKEVREVSEVKDPGRHPDPLHLWYSDDEKSAK